ncbi:MAG: MBOAT family protein [Alphaproteobacteria bacterium]|nr:MBOAT family protein [Alphaproteobacteria bacterium]
MLPAPSFWLLLAVSVPAFWAVPERWRMRLLAGVSVAAVAAAAPWVALGLLAWVITFFFLLRDPRTRRVAFVAFFVGLLLQLAAFKYLPPALPGWFGADFVVPLGLSFFTFKLLHYGIEVVRGRLEGHRLDELVAWVFLFPIFTAGPIERLDHFLAERQPRWQMDDTVAGLTRIMHGLIKKFVIADVVLVGWMITPDPLDALASIAGPGVGPWLQAWRFLGLSFLGLYMGFSGYCDMAIGASRLFGLRITENFNWPIVARNPSDFWQRWHISLSAWCQSYIYLPMIGLTRNPYLAALVTFLVMGMWHAGSVHWLLWGLWHATGVVAYMRWQRFKRRRGWRRLDQGPLRYAGVPLTLAWVSMAHAFTAFHGRGTVWDSVRLIAKCLWIDLPAVP